MSASNIEWTDETWNPTTGCTKISPGCAHCYIDRTPPFRMAGRRFEKVITYFTHLMHNLSGTQENYFEKSCKIYLTHLDYDW